MPADEPQIVAISGSFVVHPAGEQTGVRKPISMACCGTGSSPQAAETPALGEMLERYSAACLPLGPAIEASAEELGAAAIDLESLPRCSATELRHPKCPLVLPSPTARMRWTRGLNLHSGTNVCLPLVMTHTHLHTRPAERFWLQCTSGCAAHVTLEGALASAIRELIERDALSIIWLQKMALPHIEVDVLSKALEPYWQQYQRSSDRLEYRFYDATTDLDVPVVYAIRLSSIDKDVSTLVACAAAATMEEALIKAMRDLTVSRYGFRVRREYPPSWHDFHAVHHGAAFMAAAERRGAFDFLLNTPKRVALSSFDSRAQEHIRELPPLLDRLRKAGMHAYAADLTTAEAQSHGMRVVRVVIPDLQPISFSYAARFLGNPRLYELPRTMGLPSHAEEDLNPWPQPFY